MPDNHQSRLDFLEELAGTLRSLVPSGLFILDGGLRVVSVNREYCELCGKRAGDIVGREIEEVLPSSLVRDDGIGDALRKAASTGAPSFIADIRYPVPDSQSVRTLNVGIRVVGRGEQRRLLLTIDDISDRVEKIFELSMLRSVNSAIAAGDLSLNKILNLILACVTSGSALGFNRAFILFVDKAGSRLAGKMGVGPASREHAMRIWAHLAGPSKTLKDVIESQSENPVVRDVHLEEMIKAMDFSLDDDGNVAARAIREKKPFKVDGRGAAAAEAGPLTPILGSHEYVVVPMVVRDKAIGAIVADNIFSMVPITEEHVQLLTMFANQAGLALEIAEMYRNLTQERNKLKEAYRQIRAAQEKLLENERLAAVGKMAAYVSHEIRNPLVTIGGFAQSILKHPDRTGRTRQRLKVIVDEVSRLEQILTQVLVLSKPVKPYFQHAQINQVISDTCTLIGPDLQKKKIALEKKFGARLPKVMLDSKQIMQALLNLFKNSVHAMRPGGKLTVSTGRDGEFVTVTIADTGRGISKKLLDKLFMPFFTTKRKGSGIGLSVTERIINDHGGRIEVASTVGKGTTFILYLPIQSGYNAVETQTGAAVPAAGI
ncbi:MAG TPA: ATP-binding protein [bacterium]|nr:ATP-binding protein [bacterium]